MLPGSKNIRIQDAFFAYALNGASRELGVNGSVTPVRFEILFPQSNRDFNIINASLTLSGGKIDDPAGFAGLAAPGLTNGLEIGYILPAGDYPMLTSPFKTNQELVSGSGLSKPWGFNSTTKDMIQVEFLTDYILRVDAKQVTGLYVVVNDDLSTLIGRFVCRGNIV